MPTPVEKFRHSPCRLCGRPPRRSSPAGKTCRRTPWGQGPGLGPAWAQKLRQKQLWTSAQGVAESWRRIVLPAHPTGILIDGDIHVFPMAADAQTPNPEFTAIVASLTVHDSNDATGVRPPRLWRKMSTTGVHPELLSGGRHEVKCSWMIMNLSSHLAVPHGYDAVAEANTLVRR